MRLVCDVCSLTHDSESIFAGFALKLVLNAISTGANVLKGRVYGNTMINLTVANDKVGCHGYRIRPSHMIN